MRKKLTILGILFLAFIFASKVVAQQPALTGYAMRQAGSPLIDGQVDALWSNFTKYTIERNWPAKGISMQEDSSATYQICWDATNTYILVSVPDDNCFTHIEAGVESWLADKPEIYFDVNAEKVEDPPLGPSTPNSGHYQYAPDFSCMESPPSNYSVAFTMDQNGAGYIYEYAIPHALMMDIDGMPFAAAPGLVIGFDVTIIDLDAEGSGLNATAGHANWSNDMLTAGESWVDMTMSGYVIYDDGESTEELKSSDITLYPNPARSQVIISSKQSIQKIEILNLLGGVVLTNTTNNGQVQIDIHELKAGMYVVRIFSEKEMVVKSLLVE